MRLFYRAGKVAAAALFLAGTTASFAQTKITESQLSHDGTPQFIKFDYKAAPEGMQRSADVLARVLGMTPNDELRTTSSEIDELGYTHERHQQYFKGVRVEYGTYTVHAFKDVIRMANGEFKNIEDNMSVTPTLGERAAFEKALDHVGAKTYMWEGHGEEMPAGELVIVEDYNGDRTPRLAFRYNIYAAQPLSRDYVYIDAHTGKVLHTNPIIKHAHSHPAAHGAAVDLRAAAVTMAPMASGSAATRFSGTQTIDATQSGGSYRLRGTQNGVSINTYNCNEGTSYNNATDFTDNDNNWTAAEHNNADKDNGALDAHWGAQKTAEYWATEHNRDSWDGNGAAINSYVHYSSNYDNAFWNGSVMTYGDGNTFDILTSMDVVAHEIGHAVCERTANLVYSYESGAMNEGFSDIWGAAVEVYSKNDDNDPWEIGEEIGPGGDPLRSMSNPNSQGQPDTYLGTSWYSGSGDNGGVHYNSGVLNYWFYLLTNGGNSTNDNGDAFSVTGIGIDKAAAIAYRLESVYLSANSQYADARTYGIQAAQDLYGAGSAEDIATTNAFYAVGIGAEYGGGSGGGGGGGSSCVTGDVTLTLVTDNYASETSWTVKNSSGTTVYSGGGSYSNNTTYNETFTLAEGDYTFQINDSYGDGICCSYGNGSYTLADGSGATMTTGGNFGSSDSYSFCIEGSSGGGGGGGTTDNCGSASNVSASSGQWKYYTWTVDAGTEELVISITGGSGDADLYVRQGSSNPTTSAYDCRPYKNGNEETCTFSNPGAGTWKIGIRAYSTFSGVTLNACNNGVPTFTVGEEAEMSFDGETFAGAEFKIFPNPVSDRLMVGADFGINPHAAARVISTTGQIAIDFEASELREGIDVSALPKGMYILTIEDERGNLRTEKFIKE